MAVVITDPYKDLAVLNQQLTRLDILSRRISLLEQQVSGAQAQLNSHESTDRPVTTNNANFVWTGGTLTISWNAFSIRGKDGTTTAVPAGSKVLSASTYYWIYWNPVHQVMVFESTNTGQGSNPVNELLAQIFTGAGGDSGTAGGGGSESPGYGTLGTRYKQF